MKNSDAKHGKHSHMHMHEVHKAEGGKVSGEHGTMKMTSKSDGTSSGLPDTAGADGKHGYANGC